MDVKDNVVDEFDITKLGNKIRFCMLHPRYLLFVNEVGSNTNSEKDTTLNEKISITEIIDSNTYPLL